MSRASQASPLGRSNRGVTQVSGRKRTPLPAPSSQLVYGLPFWMTYLANMSLMMVVSLLFRYADFVTHLGGSELQLGLIVGVGMVGSLLMRIAQGTGIDRYGARRIWIISIVGLIVSLLGHLVITRIDGPAIYFLQILFRTSIAGAFGAAITSVCARVPPDRMAEIVGSLGTSGFLGTILGPQIGDLILGAEVAGPAQLQRMFLAAAAFGVVALVAVLIATHDDVPPRKLSRKVPLLLILRRYQPGSLLLMGVAMGFAIGLPGTFLRTYALQLDIGRIGLFFTVYASCAFATRVATRRLTDRLGSRPMVLAGMACMVVALLLYLVVDSEWDLVYPAVFTGISHALLFPAIVAGGSGAFPRRYRGVGTALMLAMFDMGTLLGAPLIGTTLKAAKSYGLPPYAVAFQLSALLLVVSTGYYAWSTRYKGSVGTG